MKMISNFSSFTNPCPILLDKLFLTFHLDSHTTTGFTPEIYSALRMLKHTEKTTNVKLYIRLLSHCQSLHGAYVGKKFVSRTFMENSIKKLPLKDGPFTVYMLLSTGLEFSFKIQNWSKIKSFIQFMPIEVFL